MKRINDITTASIAGIGKTPESFRKRPGKRTITVDADVHKKIKVFSAHSGISLADVVRAAVDAYVASQTESKGGA